MRKTAIVQNPKELPKTEIGHRQGSAQSNLSSFSKFYYITRIHLHRKRWVLRYAQRLRSIWILGPFRPYAIRYYQRFRRNRALPIDKQPVFPQLNVDRIVHDIDEQGYAYGIRLPQEYVAEIVNYCENTRRVEYWNPHKNCRAIYRIAHNEKILQIAKQYLGAEPILWLSQLRWSFGNASQKRQMLPSLYPEPVQYDGDAFHYDALDFKSLTIFIYLTDVGSDSGPHVVVERTHKTKSLSDIWRNIISDVDAERRFSDRIKMILGPKGTVLFEETSSYHKAARCKTKRLMLSIDYVLQRTPPPERPYLVASC